jgi:hypothetical protein
MIRKSQKKNETDTQNTVEGYSSRLDQAEDRITELEDKMEIKGKIEELLVKQLKSCERNMQTHQLHQKTKLEKHGHRRRRRHASKRDS